MLPQWPNPLIFQQNKSHKQVKGETIECHGSACGSCTWTESSPIRQHHLHLVSVCCRKHRCCSVLGPMTARCHPELASRGIVCGSCLRPYGLVFERIGSPWASRGEVAPRPCPTTVTLSPRGGRTPRLPWEFPHGSCLHKGNCHPCL